MASSVSGVRRGADVTLRRATIDDAGALAELGRQLGYDVTPSDIADRLSGMRDGDEVWVAATSDAVVGWIHLSPRRTLLTDPSVDVLGLVVHDDRRGQGIGRRLMELAEAWGRDRGLADVSLRSGAWRTEAHAFYAALGYRELKRSVIFRKSTAAG